MIIIPATRANSTTAMDPVDTEPGLSSGAQMSLRMWEDKFALFILRFFCMAWVASLITAVVTGVRDRALLEHTHRHCL